MIQVRHPPFCMLLDIFFSRPRKRSSSVPAVIYTLHKRLFSIGIGFAGVRSFVRHEISSSNISETV